MNIYSIIILATIYSQYSFSDKKMPINHSIFKVILKTTILILILDIFTRFDCNLGEVYCLANKVSNYLIFSTNLLTPSLWLLYVHNHLFSDIEKHKRLLNGLIYLNVFNAIAVAISQPFGWFYYFDSSNIYHRGPLYIFSFIMINALILVSCFLVYRYKTRVETRHYIALQFFALPPLIGVLLQTLFFSISIALNILVVSILLVFVNMQTNDINTDYLTGISNRNNFEKALQNKIRKATKDRTFSGIMIDIDDFKSVNDKFGHEMGDNALKAAAEILLSCLRPNDLLSRYGGDEFCVILDITDKSKLESIVERINNSVTSYNEHSGMPYKLEFSMGYDVYDYESKMTSDEFKVYIDELMYKHKPYNMDRDYIYVNTNTCGWYKHLLLFCFNQ